MPFPVRARAAFTRFVDYLGRRIFERSTLLAISTAVVTASALPRFAALFIGLGILGALVPDGKIDAPKA